MRFLSEIVKFLLRAVGFEFSPKWMVRLAIGVLIAILVISPVAFNKGVISWSNEEACTYDQVIVPAISIPRFPPMKVQEKSGICSVEVDPVTRK
jgi:uncharacterized membrane protein